MKIPNAIFYSVSALMLISILTIFLSFKNMGNYKQADVIQWYVPEIPAKLSFAGEKVPLEKLEIREQLDREFGLIYYQHGSNFYIQKLMKRYFPVIEDILKENGVPDDFKYLCIAESNLQNLISRSAQLVFGSLWKVLQPNMIWK